MALQLGDSCTPMCQQASIPARILGRDRANEAANCRGSKA